MSFAAATARVRAAKLLPACAPILALLLSGATPPAAADGGRADLHFAVIGDRAGGAVPGVYESIVREIGLLDPDFVVSVGDQIEGPVEEAGELEARWREFTGIMAVLPAPFHYCPGNNDIANDIMLEAYRRWTGTGPCTSFDHEGVHFIVLDTSRWESSAEWIERSGYADWLRRDLKKNRKARLTLVVSHKPYWFDTLAEGKADPLHELFRARGVDAVFCGHYHHYAAAEYDGIRYTIVGSSGGAVEDFDDQRGAFFQFLWCAVRGDSLDWRIIRQDGMLDRDEVRAGDLKLFARIEEDLVHAVRLPDPGVGGQAIGAITLRNPLTAPWDAVLRWQAAPGWVLPAPEQRLALGPGASASVDLVALRTGAFYPLPILHLDIPYRAGKLRHHALPLPALRRQSVVRAWQSPIIDGHVDEACWSLAEPAVEFGSPEGGPAVIEPSAVLFLYDATHLYVAARFAQRAVPLICRAASRDGAVYQDDCFGLFLSPDPASRLAYQLYFNAAGTVFDQKLSEAVPGRFVGDRSWNGEVEAAGAQLDGEWTLEVAVPYTAFGASAPQAGDSWRANFRRKEIQLASSADWQVPIDADPDRYGLLVFAGD